MPEWRGKALIFAPACECHGEPMFWKQRSDGGKGSWQCTVKRREATRKSKARARARQGTRLNDPKDVVVKHWYDELDGGRCECGANHSDHVHHIGPIPWCERCQLERR